MTSPRPAPRFEFDDDERRFLADLGLPAGEATPWEACPPPALLLAAEEQALAADTQARVSAHLATCEFCRSLVQDVRDAGPDEPTAAEHERILARLRAAAAAPPAVMERLQPARTARQWMTGPGGLLLAASLAMVVGLALYARALQQRVDALERTEVAGFRAALAREQQRAVTLEGQMAALQARLDTPDGEANVPVVDLEPLGASRAGDTIRTFTIPGGARFATLILQLEAAGSVDGLAVEIRDAQGQLQWSVGGLRASALGVVTVLVPSTGMPAGEAVITLVRSRDGRRVTTGEYRARFVRS